MRDVMIDIETLSNKSYSVITTISAVEFDLTTGETGKTFEVALDIRSQIEKGLNINNETVAWVMSQDKEAILALFELPKISVESAIYSLNDFLNSIDVHNNKMKLWGNGVSFDNVIVRNLCDAFDIPFALPYWCDNDVRTLVTLGGIDTRNFEFTGTKHKGIDDCKHQIKYCHAAYKAL